MGLTDHSLYDLAVVGGGIVGVATAREVARRHPNMRVVLLEKELMLGWCGSGVGGWGREECCATVVLGNCNYNSSNSTRLCLSCCIQMIISQIAFNTTKAFNHCLPNNVFSLALGFSFLCELIPLVPLLIRIGSHTDESAIWEKNCTG